MNLYIISAALPPKLDGIGDYTAHLAAELAKYVSVSILTSADQQPGPIPGVVIQKAFSVSHPASIKNIASIVEKDQPDWLLLQFNQFSYGRWGLNPYLPLLIRSLKRKLPWLRFAVMMHETYMPVTSWQTAIMTIWQRWQFWMLGREADLVFFSIDPWARYYKKWFPHKPVIHLPVGSSIPLISVSRKEARQRLGIADDVAVLGVFGTAHVSRMLDFVREAVETARQAGFKPLALYIGAQPQAAREALGDLPLLAEGPLEADEVSRRLAAVDVYLAPFRDGISTRRTSLITALQHGMATVGTRGIFTDEMLWKADGQAFLLADVANREAFHKHVLCLLEDPDLRERIGKQAQRLFEDQFTWERVASRLLAALHKAG